MFELLENNHPQLLRHKFVRIFRVLSCTTVKMKQVRKWKEWDWLSQGVSSTGVIVEALILSHSVVVSTFPVIFILTQVFIALICSAATLFFHSVYTFGSDFQHRWRRFLCLSFIIKTFKHFSMLEKVTVNPSGLVALMMLAILYRSLWPLWRCKCATLDGWMCACCLRLPHRFDSFTLKGKTELPKFYST